MKPLDPRLLRTAAPARKYVIITAFLGIVTAGLIIVQCLLIARALAPLVSHEAELDDVLGTVGWLALVFVLRIVVSYCQEYFGQRAGVQVVADLRSQVIRRATLLGSRWLDNGNRTDVVTLATRGLDDLQPYLTRYLPQLVLAATVTPGTLAVVLGLDWIAAVIIVVTLPLIPIFMWLVGVMTQEATARRQRTMNTLGAQVLDLVAGIPTLRALHREQGPAKRVRDLSWAYQNSTMGTLRIAFLSGMVLELLTTLSVALVAVAVGLRLVDGNLDLMTALAVIMLAPEVYQPLRNVGTHFHASADGIAATQHAFAILDAVAPDRAAQDRINAGNKKTNEQRSTSIGLVVSEARVEHVDVSDPSHSTLPKLDPAQLDIVFSGVTSSVPGTNRFAPYRLNAHIKAAELTVLTGKNGVGKSTALQLLLGVITPTDGSIALQASSFPTQQYALDTLDIKAWQRCVGWLPQRPWIRPGTLAHNVGLEDEEVTSDRVAMIAELSGLRDVFDSGHSWHSLVAAGGTGLSVGQRQRVALARLLLTDRPIIVVDEPTAHLDQELATSITNTLAYLHQQGRTIVAVSHNAGIIAAADNVIEVHDG